MPTIGGQLDPATVARLTRHTTSTPGAARFHVTAASGRVIATRDPDGLVLDLSPDEARQLGRALLDAGRTEGSE